MDNTYQTGVAPKFVYYLRMIVITRISAHD